MRKYIGVWIDHREAFILRPSPDTCSVEKIESGAERRHQSTGGRAKSRPYMHENGTSSSSHLNDARDHTLDRFYKQVCDAIGDVSDLLILGPGTAKSDFRTILAADARYHSLIPKVQSAHQITEPQLKDRVMSHFGYPPLRHLPNVPGQPPHVTVVPI